MELFEAQVFYIHLVILVDIICQNEDFIATNFVIIILALNSSIITRNLLL